MIIITGLSCQLNARNAHRAQRCTSTTIARNRSLVVHSPSPKATPSHSRFPPSLHDALSPCASSGSIGIVLKAIVWALQTGCVVMHAIVRALDLQSMCPSRSRVLFMTSISKNEGLWTFAEGCQGRHPNCRGHLQWRPSTATVVLNDLFTLLAVFFALQPWSGSRWP